MIVSGVPVHSRMPRQSVHVVGSPPRVLQTGRRCGRSGRGIIRSASSCRRPINRRKELPVSAPAIRHFPVRVLQPYPSRPNFRPPAVRIFVQPISPALSKRQRAGSRRSAMAPMRLSALGFSDAPRRSGVRADAGSISALVSSFRHDCQFRRQPWEFAIRNSGRAPRRTLWANSPSAANIRSLPDGSRARRFGRAVPISRG